VCASRALSGNGFTCHSMYDTVTCTWLAWRIIMGSGFDECVYWHFFTITINYNSSQLMTVHDSFLSLLDHDRLLFHYSHIEVPWTTSYLTNPSWRISDCLERRLANEFLKSLHCSLYRLARIHGNPRKWFIVTKTCLPKHWVLSNRGSIVACCIMCLPKRCLADGHIPSQYYLWHNQCRSSIPWNVNKRNAVDLYSLKHKERD
jgi:hypothetical protein